MLTIGLTGGIGSGKTTACNYFSALGVPVIDADIAAREVVQPGQPGLTQIITLFGSALLTSDGRLNREKLRKQIFSDESSRKEAEAILHPLIRQQMDREIAGLNAPYAILAIPLLLESRRRDGIDRVLVIDTEEFQQVARACQRDHQNEAQIRAIIATQCSRKDRLKAADDLICNTGNLKQLHSQVTDMHTLYLGLAAKKS